MKSHNNLHPQVCSLENVMAAARTAMQGKMSGHAAARFHARWETHAVRLHEELTTGTWQPGPYTYFDIHELGVKGYVRYVDDFLIFAESREQARAWGKQARESLTARGMEIHPDKYRLCRTDREGADFCGFVCFSNGRIKVRGASVRRYVKKLKQIKETGTVQEIKASVRSWIGHVSHADSWRLRAAVLGGRTRARHPA